MALKPIEILINAKDNASGVFDRLSNKLKVVGAAVAGYFGIKAFAGIVEGAAEFEGALSRVKAATGASADEMARLKQAAEDAGANTKYTSVEAAAALENLAKAGLSAGDAIETLPAVLALAQAGDIELATSAEYVTKAVMGMGLAFSDAGRVADVLAMGANATNTSVEGLAQALSYAAPTAASLGVSLEGTVAIIGKFADAGIDASRAGTALNSIMSQFSDPASKFRKELADIGITTGDFETALKALAESGGRGAKAINAVGLEAGPALKALLNQGMPALTELKDKLEGAAGSAAEVAKTMGDNLTGAMTGLGSAWDTVKNVLGTPVLPVLKDGVDQLAGAFRSAVSDGTVAKFGEAIATGFQAGIQWAKEFLAQVDFTALAASLRAFADRAGEAFAQLGEYASNAGNIVKTAYGVMSAGTNAVLAAIYGIGSVFSEMASTVLAGVAKLREGLATITFGKLSESFKLAADDARSMAQGFGEAAQAMRDKAAGALADVADGAQLARDGFAGLTGAATAAAPAIGALGAAQAQANKELEAGASAAAAAGVAAQKKAQADQQSAQAAEEHRAALATLRAEYAALVASGNLQAAAEKLGEINKALRDTGPAAQDAGKAAEAAAARIAEAFSALGITSTAVLKTQADNAKAAYDTIRAAGTSTAQDIGAAFKAAADKAIAANNGIAPSWVAAQAAAQGYSVAVDVAGKSTLELKSKTDAAAQAAVTGHQRAGQAVDQHRTALERLNAEKEREISALEKANQLKEREEELERKKRNVDKQGFVLNKNGERLQASAPTERYVFDTAKNQGLDEATALKLVEKYMRNGRASGWQSGNPNQMDWFSVVNKAVSDEVLRQAKERVRAQPPLPAQEPERNQRPSGGGGSGSGAGNTYISNITIPGVGNASLNFSDASSQRQAEEFIRQLAQAKGAAVR